MYRSRESIKCFALFLLFSLCLIKQASSIKCYACNSDADPACISAVNQSRFAVECSPLNMYTTNTSSIFKNHDHVNHAQKSVEYDCGYAKGISTVDGRTIVVRGCAVKAVKCETYKIVYAVGDNKGNGLQVETCRRCDYDLCNSSGHLSVGIGILMLSLLTIYLSKL